MNQGNLGVETRRTIYADRFRRGAVTRRTVIRDGVCAARHRRRSGLDTSVSVAVVITSKLWLKNGRRTIQTATGNVHGTDKLGGGSARGVFY